MAGGRPCQLSHSDWSFHSHSFRPSGPSPAWVFIALLLHNTPKFGHHSLSSIKGGMLGSASKCKVICHREVPKPQIHGPQGHNLSRCQFRVLLPTLNIRESSPSYASQRERWRSSKRSTDPCLTVFMRAIDLRRRVFQTLLQFRPYKVLFFPQLIPNSRVTG